MAKKRGKRFLFEKFWNRKFLIMLSKNLEKLLKSSKKNGFIYPRYDGYSLYNLVPTIYKLFNLNSGKISLPQDLYKNYINKSQKIVLFIADGFGYNQYKNLKAEISLLDKIYQKGNVFPITSVFPSTTTASLTTLATGLTPEEHGLFEWNLYIEELDEIIQTLPFSHLGKTAKTDELLELGISPNILISQETIHSDLSRKGINSYVFSDIAIANSSYSRISSKGAEKVVFEYLSDLIFNLLDFLTNKKGPALFYVYWAGIDSQGHKFSPKSKQYFLEAKIFFDSLQELLIKKLDKKTLEESLFLLTSDHGQVSINPGETTYLNNDKKLILFLKKSKNGKTILPTGNLRDVFLFVDDKMINQTIYNLDKAYGKLAYVLKTEDAIKGGLFGKGNPSKTFLQRAGNIIILPYKNNTIWYEHIKGEFVTYKGHHGGLSEDEMLIPFAIARFKDLV